MRMSVRVTVGVLLAGLLGALLAIGIAAGPATASQQTAAPVHLATVHPAGLAAAAAAKAASPTTPVTASPTTDFNKGQQAADAALAKRKLIVGIICVVLLVIVYLGHRAKGKHVLRVKNLQNAKS
ncbi:MAG TPA: hypothetical protein VFW65_24195 [Pseudonocardiaceae bacterium]|nr:hypothetical protein [Pseudonocardiaceae bacterium]